MTPELRDYEPLDPTDRRLVVAIHEAGHCVAALEYGISIEYATIRPGHRPDGRRLAGRVVFHQFPLYPAVARATVTIAGFTATALTFPDRTIPGCRGDLDELEAIEAEYPDLDLTHTGPMLVRRFPRLVGITRALLDAEYLLGMRIEAIADQYDGLTELRSASGVR